MDYHPSGRETLNSACKTISRSRFEAVLLTTEGAYLGHPPARTLQRLRDKGFRVAVVSSNQNACRLLVLETGKLTSFFEGEGDGHSVAILNCKDKPRPNILLEATCRLGVAPERCIIFEDTIGGVQAGRRGGFGLVIGVSGKQQAEALRKAGADFVIPDLAEVKIAVPRANLSSALGSLSMIQKQLRRREIFIFLDYDGTLTPLVPDPEKAFLKEETRRVLKVLAHRVPVAVISGRSLKDVQRRVALKDLYYGGSHGFEIVGPQGLEWEQVQARNCLPLLGQAEEELRKRLENIPGAQLEQKRFSIAIHYRNVAEAQHPDVKTVVHQILSRHPVLQERSGKNVYELQPAVAWNKGRALLWLLDQLKFKHSEALPLYLGDDLTDEDAFKVLEGYGIGIVVGEGTKDTHAEYRLQDPDQVKEFLQALIKIL